MTFNSSSCFFCPAAKHLWIFCSEFVTAPGNRNPWYSLIAAKLKNKNRKIALENKLNFRWNYTKFGSQRVRKLKSELKVIWDAKLRENSDKKMGIVIKKKICKKKKNRNGFCSKSCEIWLDLILWHSEKILFKRISKTNFPIHGKFMVQIMLKLRKREYLILFYNKH